MMEEEASGVVIDESTGEPQPGSLGKDGRRIDLSNLRDVRIEMAKVYRMMDSGDLPHADGTKRVYVLAEIGKVITIADLEKRLSDLEQKQLPGGSRSLALVNRSRG